MSLLRFILEPIAVLLGLIDYSYDTITNQDETKEDNLKLGKRGLFITILRYDLAFFIGMFLIELILLIFGPVSDSDFYCNYVIIPILIIICISVALFIILFIAAIVAGRLYPVKPLTDEEMKMYYELGADKWIKTWEWREQRQMYWHWNKYEKQKYPDYKEWIEILQKDAPRYYRHLLNNEDD